MVEPHRQLDDAVAEPDPVRALTGGGQKDLGRRGVRVLLEEVMLDLPDVVEAQAVGQLYLLQRLLEEAVFVVAVPGTRELELVEDPESHVGRRLAVVLMFEHGVDQALDHDTVTLGQPAQLHSQQRSVVLGSRRVGRVR